MIDLANKHKWAPMTSTSACGAARTSVRHFGHPARARELLRKFFPFFERKGIFLSPRGSIH